MDCAVVHIQKVDFVGTVRIFKRNLRKKEIPMCQDKLEIVQNKLHFETNDSDNKFILRRFDPSCIIFKLRMRIIRV